MGGFVKRQENREDTCTLGKKKAGRQWEIVVEEKRERDEVESRTGLPKFNYSTLRLFGSPSLDPNPNTCLQDLPIVPENGFCGV